MATFCMLHQGNFNYAGRQLHRKCIICVVIVQKRWIKLQVFLNFCTTSTSVDYEFSLLIFIVYTEFGPSCTADDQTFWAIAQLCCLSAKPSLQSLHSLGSIIVCVLRVWFVCYSRKLFETAYHTMPICSRSSDKTCSFLLPFHTCPLHFSSAWGLTAESQTAFCLS